MAGSKALALVLKEYLREYGFMKVLGVLFLISSVYGIIELVIVRVKKEKKGKKLSDEELKKITKESIITAILAVIIGLGLILWP